MLLIKLVILVHFVKMERNVKFMQSLDHKCSCRHNPNYASNQKSSFHKSFRAYQPK